jgi:hypothetical protein
MEGGLAGGFEQCLGWRIAVRSVKLEKRENVERNKYTPFTPPWS